MTVEHDWVAAEILHASTFTNLNIGLERFIEDLDGQIIKLEHSEIHEHGNYVKDYTMVVTAYVKNWASDIEKIERGRP